MSTERERDAREKAHALLQDILPTCVGTVHGGPDAGAPYHTGLCKIIVAYVLERDADVDAQMAMNTLCLARAKDAEEVRDALTADRDTWRARHAVLTEDLARAAMELTEARGRAAVAEDRAEKAEASRNIWLDRAEKAEALLNTPEIVDFAKAVQLEAAHQRSRWGSAHGDGKADEDWFWLIGYLAGKALRDDGREKRLHRIVTVAAAACNWHAANLGQTNMRPGIATPAGETT